MRRRIDRIPESSPDANGGSQARLFLEQARRLLAWIAKSVAFGRHTAAHRIAIVDGETFGRGQRGHGPVVLGRSPDADLGSCCVPDGYAVSHSADRQIIDTR